MQREGNNLAHIMLMYLCMVRHIVQYVDQESLDDALLIKLEAQWKREGKSLTE
jgi:hypothetical protein